jgi:hypothetical protein
MGSPIGNPHARWHAARGYHIPAHYLHRNAIVDLNDHPLTGQALTDLPRPSSARAG